MLTAVVGDDHEPTRRKIEAALRVAGFKVVAEADNADATVQKAMAFRPSLITLDVVMPPGDGKSAALKLRKDLPGTPIIMMTSMGQDAVLKELRDLGFGILIKPFETHHVFQALAEADAT